MKNTEVVYRGKRNFGVPVLFGLVALLLPTVMLVGARVERARKHLMVVDFPTDYEITHAPTVANLSDVIRRYKKRYQFFSNSPRHVIGILLKVDSSRNFEWFHNGILQARLPYSQFDEFDSSVCQYYHVLRNDSNTQLIREIKVSPAATLEDFIRMQDLLNRIGGIEPIGLISPYNELPVLTSAGLIARMDTIERFNVPRPAPLKIDGFLGHDMVFENQKKDFHYRSVFDSTFENVIDFLNPPAQVVLP